MNTSKEDETKKQSVGGDTGTTSPMDGLVAVAAAAAAISDNKDDSGNIKKKRKQSSAQQQKDGAQISAARARRLEQNRRAAIESRRRKKAMIAELQRSVTFYSKANENLKKSNDELEELLLVTKQKISQKDDDVESAAGGLKTPEEDKSSAVGGSPGVEAKAEEQPTPIAIPTPSFASVDPANIAHADQANFSAMQAMYENMGYPAVAARSAASVFSQFGTGFDDAKNPDPVLPDANSLDTDAYIRSLEQYALQKTAAANAATLAANEAMRIANWHKMMKSSGQSVSITSSDGKPPPVPSVKEEK